jgi:HSP20 family protein
MHCSYAHTPTPQHIQEVTMHQFRTPFSVLADLERIINEVGRAQVERANQAERASQAAHDTFHLHSNVWHHSNGSVITAEVPGIDPKQLSVSVTGTTLTITYTPTTARAETPNQHSDVKAETHTITLPFTPDSERSEARYQHGVLHISLPKLISAAPRTIPIQVA